MRVSFRGQYSNFLYNLHDSQSRLMDLNIQHSSQKRINKPSDDPIGTARVMDYRNTLSAIGKYQDNVKTAKGWLNLADETMLQTSTVLTKLRGLAEQGATGTLKGSDREAISYEARQLFEQLISLSNTRYEGNAIFAGHKVEDSAYTAGLMAFSQSGESLGWASGSADHSIVVQFLGTEGTASTVGGTDNIDYRYSSDGGTTWTNRTLGSGELVLDLGGASVTLIAGVHVELSPEENTKTSMGTWLTVAPTALYHGDHEVQSAVQYGAAGPTFMAQPLGGFEQDVRVIFSAGVVCGDGTPFTVDIETVVNKVPRTMTLEVENLSTTPILTTPYGGIQLSGTVVAGNEITVKAGMTPVQNLGADVNAMGKGVFTRDVMVRADNDTPVTIGDGTAITYAYSTDGGSTWSGGHTARNETGATKIELLVPGGALVLEPRGSNNAVDPFAQFVIHPHTAGHNLEISTGQYLRINNIGSEIFGGHYAGGGDPIFADSDPGKNIFVTVGKLVAALENNDQQGCAQALENLRSGQEYFATQLASVGGRENRLEVAATILSGLKLNQEERMSAIEDVDLPTLLTDMARQQLSYEAVLRSSSMIMKMGLINYL